MENLENLGRVMNIQIHDAQRSTNRVNIKNFTWHIIIKMSEVKKRELENGKRKGSHHIQVTYRTPQTPA